MHIEATGLAQIPSRGGIDCPPSTGPSQRLGSFRLTAPVPFRVQVTSINDNLQSQLCTSPGRPPLCIRVEVGVIQ